MKIGILGTGFGVVHIEAFKKNPLVSDIIVFSRSSEKTQDIANKYGVSTTNNMQDIFSDKEIQVVTVALPTELHHDVIIKALENGKDVISEIPVTNNIEELKSIQATVEKTGKRVLADLFMRFRPAYQYLHDISLDQRYGKLLSLKMQNASGPVWGGDIPLGLNRLIKDAGLSDFDFMSWLMNTDNIQVDSLVGNQVDPNHSTIHALFKSKDTILEWSSSSTLPISYAVQENYEAIFEKATIKYSETSWSENKDAQELTVYESKEVKKIPLKAVNHYAASLNYSLNQIAKKQTGKTDLKEAKSSLKLVEEMQKLIEKGAY